MTIVHRHNLNNWTIQQDFASFIPFGMLFHAFYCKEMNSMSYKET